MSEENTSPQNFTLNTNPEFLAQTAVKPKKKGCGCFLIGCFSVLFLFATLIAGGVVYIYSLEPVDYLEMLNGSLTRSLATGALEGILDKTDLTADQKTAITSQVEQISNRFASLSEADKQRLNKTLKTLFGKFQDGIYHDKTNILETPEVKEVMRMLQVNLPGMPPVTNNPVTPTTPTSPTTNPVSPSGLPDPNSFDLPPGTPVTPPPSSPNP